jgi:hypothetical protein
VVENKNGLRSKQERLIQSEMKNDQKCKSLSLLGGSGPDLWTSSSGVTCFPFLWFPSLRPQNSLLLADSFGINTVLRRQELIFSTTPILLCLCWGLNLPLPSAPVTGVGRGTIAIPSVLITPSFSPTTFFVRHFFWQCIVLRFFLTFSLPLPRRHCILEKSPSRDSHSFTTEGRRILEEIIEKTPRQELQQAIDSSLFSQMINFTIVWRERRSNAVFQGQSKRRGEVQVQD